VRGRSRSGDLGRGRHGAPLQPRREYNNPRVSPDGTEVAVTIGPGRGRECDVWIGDLARGTIRRLTLDGRSGAPAWTRDGGRVAFASTGTNPAGGDTLAWKAADGSDAAEVLVAFPDSVPRSPLSWTPDGRGLVYMQDRGPGHSNDILLLDLETKETRDVAATDAIEFDGSLSPDGQWLTYTSDESGRAEVYLQAYPGPGGRWQLSERGGYPLWSRDGSELYYLDGRTLLAVPIQRTPRFTPGAPQVLFEQVFRVETETNRNYDVAPDGRFLVVRDTAEESMAQHINVVFGWGKELRRATGR
jgi:Tol biopolymer transport system component